MINRKIVTSTMSIITAFSLMTGATYAYFTDTQTSTNNAFAAGTLNVSITDQNADTGFINESLATNWQPGEERLVNFDVKNTGSLPVQLRGFATGAWSDAALDAQNAVKVTKVERWNGSAWEIVAANPSGLTGFFYYSNDGTDTGTFVNVASSSRAQFQLTVKLDSTAGNDFQGETFTSALTIQARQTTAGATWPL